MCYAKSSLTIYKLYFPGDYGSGRAGSSTRYNTSSLERGGYSEYSRPLQRSSSALGSRNSVDRYSTSSLTKGGGGYTSDYGSSNISSTYGTGYNR